MTSFTYRLLISFVGLSMRRRFPRTVFSANVNQKIRYIPLRAFSKQPWLCLHLKVFECRQLGRCSRSIIDLSSFLTGATSPLASSLCSSLYSLPLCYLASSS